MSKALQGKVAEVLSADSIAINLGSTAGVQPGDEVQVRRRVVVRDPDTREELGAVLVSTVRLTVSKVWERMATAVVTERAEPFDPARAFSTYFTSSGNKKITTSEADADARTVWVAKGDFAIVSTKGRSEDG